MRTTNKAHQNAFLIVRGSLILITAAIAFVLLTYGLEHYAAKHYNLETLRRPLIPFFLNVALILCFEVFLLAVCRNIIAATILASPIVLTFAFAHFIKLQFRHDPLMPGDFFLFREAFSIGLTFVHPGLLGLTISIIIASLYFCVHLSLRKPHIRSLKIRALIAILSLVLPSLFIWHKQINASQKLQSLGVSFSVWSPKETLLANGLFVDLLLKLHPSIPRPPSNYSKETVNKIKASFNFTATKSISTKTPNVIIYMMESFSDPIELGIRVNRDPIAFFRSLRRTSPKGRILTPAYGGNTSNVEFEILTGLKILNLPISTAPYHFFVNRPIPALPQVFRDLGYKTFAIHPFYGWFWSRNKAFPYMGFETFIDVSYFKNIKIIGRYTSDYNLVDEIIKIANTSESPLFIYALTMSGHGPYDTEISPETRILVKNRIEEPKRRILQNYVDLLYHADKALQRLVSYFETIDRPTLIVAFGDHFPPLGEAAESLNSKMLTFDGIPISDMQVAVWSNYPLNSNEDFQLPSFGLGKKILDLANLPSPSIFQMAYLSALQMVENLPETSPAKMRKILPKNALVPKNASTDAHALIQYDLLLGNQFFLLTEKNHD